MLRRWSAPQVEEMCGRTQRVEPRVGGLRWHAMRVGRLLYCGALKAWRTDYRPFTYNRPFSGRIYRPTSLTVFCTIKGSAISVSLRRV